MKKSAKKIPNQNSEKSCQGRQTKLSSYYPISSESRPQLSLSET